MANQKITDLRSLNAETISREDLLPVVDVSENTSPTGELKKISVNQLIKNVTDGVLSQVYSELITKSSVGHRHLIADIDDLENRLDAIIPQVRLPKVWVNFNGNDGTIRSSYNVSSVIRDSVGNYTINFIDDIASGACVVCSGMVGGGSAATDDQLVGVKEINENYVKVSCVDATDAGINFEDCDIISVVVYCN